MKVSSIRTVLLDMDGVIYLGKRVVPGAVAAIARLRENGLRVCFCSNNSSKSRTDYQEKLRSLGIPSEIEEIVNSARATALYLEETGKLPCRVLVVGGAGLGEELSSVGAEVVVDGVTEADFVIVGFDRQFNYETLTRAFKALEKGAGFIATNRDATLPLEDGQYPGGGTMVAAIETAIGRPPIVIGKPSPYSLLKLLEQVGGSPETAMMVGDRLETDILAGKQGGLQTTLVLTGVSTREEADEAPDCMTPDHVLDSVANLPDLLV
ncbi:MAG: phosphoglycolate/pyridoxal phosphate family phosphatase [Armatimonadetes bacterium]|nr:phosphoglycolate/pyridoxal phosphate family phosphatase [Armatimonadota bacterium]